MCDGGKAAVDLDQPADQRRQFFKSEIHGVNDGVNNRAHGAASRRDTASAGAYLKSGWRRVT